MADVAIDQAHRGWQNFPAGDEGLPARHIERYHDNYLWHLKDWSLIETCLKGERAVKEESLASCSLKTGLLPYPVALDGVDRTAEEFQNFYHVYLNGAHYVNFTLQALQDLVSGVFQRKPYFDNFPNTLYYLDLQHLARRLVTEVTAYGRAFALVDFPDVGDRIVSRDEMERFNIRANVLQYSAKQIEDWDESIVYGNRILTRVKINQTENRPVINLDGGDNLNQTVNVYKELVIEDDVYKILTYKGDVNQYDITEHIPKAQHQTLNEIPGTFVGVFDNGVDVDTSPVLGIAQSNIQHYRHWAEMAYQASYASHPEKVIEGLEPGFNRKKEAKEKETGQPVRLGIGASNVTLLEGDAKAKILEINGNNIMSLKILEKIEDAMTEQNARIKTRNYKSGVESAESLIIRSSGDNSMLANVAQNVESAINRLVYYAGRFMAVDTDGFNIDINKEFINFQPDAQLLSTLNGMAAGNPGYTKVLINYMRATGLILNEDDQIEIESKVMNANPYTG